MLRARALLQHLVRPKSSYAFAGGASPAKRLGERWQPTTLPDRASPNPLARVRAMVGPGNLGRQERPYARASRKNRDALATGRYCVQGTSGSSGVRALRCAAIWWPPFLTLRRRVSRPWRRPSCPAGRYRSASSPMFSQPTPRWPLGELHRARARCTYRSYIFSCPSSMSDPHIGEFTKNSSLGAILKMSPFWTVTSTRTRTRAPPRCWCRLRTSRVHQPAGAHLRRCLCTCE